MQIFDALEKGLAIPRNPAGPVRPTGPLRNTPSDGQLNEILEAVRWAPSAYNTQPWHFQILCSPDHREEAARALSLSRDPKSEAAWILCYLDRPGCYPSPTR